MIRELLNSGKTEREMDGSVQSVQLWLPGRRVNFIKDTFIKEEKASQKKIECKKTPLDFKRLWIIQTICPGIEPGTRHAHLTMQDR